MPNIDTLIAFENGELDQDQVVEFIQDGIDNGWVWRLLRPHRCQPNRRRTVPQLKAEQAADECLTAIEGLMK